MRDEMDAEGYLTYVDRVWFRGENGLDRARASRLVGLPNLSERRVGDFHVAFIQEKGREPRGEVGYQTSPKREFGMM